MLTQEEKQQLLAAEPFQYLEPQELEMLISYSKTRSFSPGQILLQQGKYSDGMYIIIHGETSVQAKVLGKGLMELALLHYGAFVGEISLLENVPCVATVIATTQVECLLITKTYFEMLLIFFPDIRYKITKAIARVVCYRIREIHNNIICIMKKSDIASHFTFEKMIQSFTHPKVITYEEANLTIEQITKLEFFNFFNTAESKQLLESGSLISAAKKCSLIREGEQEAPYYLIIRGAVQSSILLGDNKAKLYVLGPSSLLGSMFYIDGNPTILSYTTCEPVILLKFSHDDLANIHKINIKLWFKLYNIICRSFVKLERYADKLYIRLNNELYNR